MRHDKNRQHCTHTGQSGFTLIEILVVVAIIGILGSIAVPALQSAMKKSKRNATVAELRVFRDSMQRYAADKGHFPLWDEFELASLAPLEEAYMKRPEKLVKNLSGAKFDLYVPWNLLEVDELTFSMFTSPQSFLALGTLDYDKDIRLIVTDSTIYYYMNGKITPIGDN